MKITQRIKKAFIRGGAFAAGLTATGLLAATISGTVHTFNPGDIVSSTLMNENFTSLKTAIEGIKSYDLDFPSTDLEQEVDTGKKWIDGKIIYRKRIDLDGLPSNSYKTVPHGISGLTMVISLSGVAHADNGSYRPIPSPAGLGGNGDNEVFLLITGDDVYVRTNGNNSSYKGFVIMEYTK